MASSHDAKVLVSFDVDGTLIRSRGEKANRLHKDGFQQGVKAVFNEDCDIEDIEHHGLTDPMILVKLAMAHGVDKQEAMAKLEQMKQACTKHVIDNQERIDEGLELLQGVKELLNKLRDNAITSCLVTGNLEDIGWAKMQGLGIKDNFNNPKFGGFGSDYCSGNFEEPWKDRGELIDIARQKGEKIINDKFRKKVHVGDTPFDVQAARDKGAVPIGVLTGIFDAKALLDANPDSIIFEDLKDTEKFLKLCLE